MNKIIKKMKLPALILTGTLATSAYTAENQDKTLNININLNDKAPTSAVATDSTKPVANYNPNKIMPYGDISCLTGEILGQKAFITMNPNIPFENENEAVLDLTKFPINKEGYQLQFKPLTIRQAFKSIYGRINGTSMYNDATKKQKIKNYKELEKIINNANYVSADSIDWNQYVADGKIMPDEFKKLDLGVYAVVAEAIDTNGKVKASMPFFIERGEGYVVNIPQPVQPTPAISGNGNNEKNNYNKDKYPTLTPVIGAGTYYDFDVEKLGAFITAGLQNGKFSIEALGGMSLANKENVHNYYPGPFGSTTEDINTKTYNWKAGGILGIGGKLKLEGGLIYDANHQKIETKVIQELLDRNYNLDRRIEESTETSSNEGSWKPYGGISLQIGKHSKIKTGIEGKTGFLGYGHKF